MYLRHNSNNEMKLIEKIEAEARAYYADNLSQNKNPQQGYMV